MINFIHFSSVFDSVLNALAVLQYQLLAAGKMLLVRLFYPTTNILEEI